MPIESALVASGKPDKLEMFIDLIEHDEGYLLNQASRDKDGAVA